MVKTVTLSNGIRLVMEPMLNLRTVSFGVWVKVGSVNETQENNGISHVIEHCLFKGTKTRSAKQLADEISAIGDQLNAFTGKECTAFYGVTLTEYLPKLIELMGDMLQNSTFEEEPLKKELGVILEEIDMYDDSPEDLVHELLQKKVWEDHPLGYIISGEKSVVSAMTKEQILKNAAWQARQMVSEAEVVRTSTLENALEDAKKESERIMNEAKNYDAKVKAEAEEIVNMTLTERRQELEDARKELEDSREGVLEEARKEGEKMLEAVRKEAEELRQRLDEEIENYRKAREAELKESLKEAQQIAQATLEEKTRDALQLYADTVHKTEEMANLIVAIYEQQMEVIQQDRKDISAIVEKLERQGVHQGLQRSRR